MGSVCVHVRVCVFIFLGKNNKTMVLKLSYDYSYFSLGTLRANNHIVNWKEGSALDSNRSGVKSCGTKSLLH